MPMKGVFVGTAHREGKFRVKYRLAMEIPWNGTYGQPMRYKLPMSISRSVACAWAAHADMRTMFHGQPMDNHRLDGLPMDCS